MSMTVTPALLNSDQREQVNINGSWFFELDPLDVGLYEAWFRRDLAGSIVVPGSWEEQGYGERPPENIGGWTKRRSYEGVAWYQRKVDIPAGWVQRRVWCQLDRVGWKSTLWVNDTEVASCDSISTPHRFDITGHVTPGTTSSLTIRVANVLPDLLNYEGHIHSRHTATTWGGIIGAARLIATPLTWIEHVAVRPHVDRRSVTCRIQVRGASADATVAVQVREDPGSDPLAEVESSISIEAGSAVVDLEAELGDDARLWSDRDPYLYYIAVRLRIDDGEDVVQERFGLREFRADGRHLLLNGNPFFLRGYVDCCIFPLTGYPPEDGAIYARQFEIAKLFGFNHVRLHSWVPSRAFFDAADEAGMLVQCELPNWSNCNDPYTVERIGGFLQDELERVVTHLQRHPSLVMHSMGNELLQVAPGGTPHRYSPFLNELVERGKELDPDKLYIDQSGFGVIPEEAKRWSDVSVYHTFRGSSPDTTETWWQRIAGGAVPVIAHEHTQMDMYPRFDEFEKYTGIMEASWLLQARAGLESTGVLDRAKRFVDASAALQTRCLKELFERIRRTPELAGVQMLNLTDFPGQGAALNGVLDAFWDEKEHITPNEFRRFNDETVLLCSCPRRTFRGGSQFSTSLLLSHFGYAALDGELRWILTTDDQVLGEGQATAREVPSGEPRQVASVSAWLPAGMTAKLVLAAVLETDGKIVSNSWDYWVFDEMRRTQYASKMLVRPTLSSLTDVYPFLEVDTFGTKNRRKTTPEHITILTDVMHVRYVEAMYNGATMLYLAEGDELQDGVASRFESLFWSYLWFTNQPNQTMGLTIEDHPALGTFPHDGHSDWQWYHLVDGATAVGLDHLPRELNPVVGAIDNWNRGKRLGYLFEARVGKGRFLMTTLKLLDRYPQHPEAVHLLDTLLRYVVSPEFQPETDLTMAQLWAIPKHAVGWPRP